LSNTERPLYRRNRSIKFKKSRVRLSSRVPAGTLIEFQYGVQKEVNESGGWKNDPRPILLVFYDDQSEYIEGVNTNYLEDKFLRDFMEVLENAPGIGKSTDSGKRLYKLMKSVDPDLLKAYRKYKRKSILAVWKMEVDLTK